MHAEKLRTRARRTAPKATRQSIPRASRPKFVWRWWRSWNTRIGRAGPAYSSLSHFRRSREGRASTPAQRSSESLVPCGSVFLSFRFHSYKTKPNHITATAIQTMSSADGQSTQPPNQEPKLCKMGCGFFVSDFEVRLRLFRRERQASAADVNHAWKKEKAKRNVAPSKSIDAFLLLFVPLCSIVLLLAPPWRAISIARTAAILVQTLGLWNFVWLKLSPRVCQRQKELFVASVSQ